MNEKEKKSASPKDKEEELRKGKGMTKPGSKKRKRGDRKDRWRKDQESYYHRLLHGAQKDLNKQAKIVKNFECQKMVRKIKERKESDGDATSKVAEDNYQRLKSFDLDRVVQESLRRLGILHLDPKLAEEALMHSQTSSEKNDDESVSDASDAVKDTTFVKHQTNLGRQTEEEDKRKSDVTQSKEAALVEKILRHKKMQSTLEKWNGQVTEYRRWCLQQEDRENPRFDYGTEPIVRKKKKKSKREFQNGISNSAVDESDKSLFVRLGGSDGDGDGDGDDEDDGETTGMDAQYGPGTFVEEKKKNRKGQRARRAKAMAIEAKKVGRVHRASDSMNWRPKKQHQSPEDVYGDHNNNHSNASNQRAPTFGKEKSAPSAASETLHPSWAAKKKDSTGIVEFKGTKITF